MTIIYLDRQLPVDSSDSTRKVPRAASSLPYSVLLHVGFTEPASHLTAGALLPHLSTLTCCAGGLNFYSTFPKVTLAGRYPAHRPVEPGLSSNASKALAIIFHTQSQLSEYNILAALCQFSARKHRRKPAIEALISSAPTMPETTAAVAAPA